MSARDIALAIMVGTLLTIMAVAAVLEPILDGPVYSTTTEAP